jgi:hypothetical protein
MNQTNFNLEMTQLREENERQQKLIKTLEEKNETQQKLFETLEES